MSRSTRIAPLAFGLALIAVGQAPLPAQRRFPSSPQPPETTLVNGVNVAQLTYRFIGPQGNRVSAVVGEPGNSNVYYIGAASGGIWKSTDGGTNWTPVFDKMPAQSIGALAITPSDHSIVWAGTGETFIRSNVSIGDGIYKSTDGGQTWTHMGLDNTGRIGRIIVDPHDPNIVYAAALGRGYGPQQERGVYRTTDGGKTWERVLFVNDSTGASDLTMDPHDSRTLFAGMWQFVIHTWGQYSGGSGSGVYVTHDGGTTWTHIIGHGLPSPPLGKVAVAIAPSDSKRVYALIETGWEGKGSLWRSDDGGENWHVVSYSHLLAERPHYYTRMLVSPSNENEVYFPSNSMLRTLDGGETSETIPWGGDNHDMWADPTSADRMMLGFDGGAAITTTHGKGWNYIVLPIGQMYHVAVDTQVPYFVYGNEQDYSSVRGPSNSLEGFGIPSGLWTTTAGCESGFSYPDPVDNNIVWGGCYEGRVERYDLRTRQSHSVDPWPDNPLDSPADSVKYRWNWTFPIAISPHDHNTVYVGSQYVHKTTDGGQSWTIISPDLTTDDTSKMGPSGGLTKDNLGVEYCCTLFAIAESPVERGLIWAGSNDGLVHVTRDSGAHWTNVTPNIPNLPPEGTISNIEPSRYDAGTAYISVNFHQVDNRDPYIYKTSDYGKTWKFLSAGIPKSVFSYVHIVREDPKRKGMLYAGTENGIYVSLDDGGHWFPLQMNLPHAPVSWIAIQEPFNDLVLSTKGRGFWILDDLSPLQQLDAKVLASTAYLFPLRPAYRFRTVNRMKTAPNDQSDGRNPPYGADINYYLKAASPDSSKNAVRVVIRDARGGTVRTLRATAKAGINRMWWDLRYERTREIELRTTPPGYPQIWEEKRFIGKKTRNIVHYGIQETKLGPLVAPGTYTVELTVAGEHVSQPLTVLKDPHSAGTDADIQAATALSLQLRNEIDTVADAVNRIERVRKQLEDLRDMYGHDSSERAVLAAAKSLDGKLSAAENTFLQPVLQEDDEKTYRAPMHLYLRLLWLAGSVGTGAGDVSGNPDFAPTSQDLAVHALLQQQLRDAMAAYRTVMERDVPAFNREMGSKTGVVVQ